MRYRGAADSPLFWHTLDRRPETASKSAFVDPLARARLRRSELPGAVRVLTSLGSLGRPSFNDAYRDALCVLTREARNQPVACP